MAKISRKMKKACEGIDLRKIYPLEYLEEIVKNNYLMI